MKFSVLLPTRNRLDLLSAAIKTVRRQDYYNWELIVSDNCSVEDVEGYIRSLGDPRIKYFRSPKIIPVTENWNNALKKCKGEYIIMLGDDDCLVKEYFSTLKKIIDKHGSPDLIYTSAFLYAYPSVMPGAPEGFLKSYGTASIFKSGTKPFWLNKSEARKLVESSMDFKLRFDYNMQFSLINRKLIKELEKYGNFYQSPYPDYYASNAIMLKAAQILIVPIPMVTIGISAKSFGYFYFNDAESDGTKFLQNFPDPEMVRRLEQILLPGTNMNTCWLMSMETLAQNFGQEANIKVNYRRYRFLQISAIYSRLILRKKGAYSLLIEARRRMTITERAIYDLPLAMINLIALILPNKYQELIAGKVLNATGSHPAIDLPTVQGQFATIMDVFEKVSSKSFQLIDKESDFRK